LIICFFSTTTRTAGGLKFTAAGGKKEGEAPHLLRVKPGAKHPVLKNPIIGLDLSTRPA
jgi:hypothetical protein